MSTSPHTPSPSLSLSASFGHASQLSAVPSLSESTSAATQSPHESTISSPAGIPAQSAVGVANTSVSKHPLNGS